LWVDLAREYSALGQLRPAEKAVRIAMDLAPDNRFVVRSASRFFLHANDAERAHDVLLRAPSVRSDPWLAAAEIVAAEATETESRLLANGRDLVEAGNFKPRHISELASALGTLEHRAGKRKRVRRLFEAALKDPTENSVAQAVWVERHMPGFNVPDSALDAPRAFEAGAWEAVQSGEYPRAVSLSTDWLMDEPFAPRPARFGSWIASTALGDYDLAADLVETALVANPNDARLLAQLLYCKASAGKVDAAESLLPRLEEAIKDDTSDRSPAEWDVFLNADRGLIAFRKGQVGDGGRFYEKAIELARSHGLQEAAASASIHYARERVLADPTAPLDESELASATAEFSQPSQAVFAQLVDRIRRRIVGNRPATRTDGGAS